MIVVLLAASYVSTCLMPILVVLSLVSGTVSGHAYLRLKAAVCKNWRMFILISVICTCYQIRLFTTARQSAYAALGAAFLQLLRQPSSLKDWLKEWRIASGPVYTLTACVTFSYQFHKNSDIIALIGASIGMLSASLAAVALRPDNQELDRAVIESLQLQALPWPRSWKARVRCHGLLMMCSMICMAVVQSQDASSHSLTSDAPMEVCHTRLILSFCIVLLLMELVRRSQISLLAIRSGIASFLQSQCWQIVVDSMKCKPVLMQSKGGLSTRASRLCHLLSNHLFFYV